MLLTLQVQPDRYNGLAIKDYDLGTNSVTQHLNFLNESIVFGKAVLQANALNLQILHATRTQLVMELPYSNQLVGNPETGTLHGGCIITLMDSCCGLTARNALFTEEICPTLDLRIDYLRTPKINNSVYAKAECYRITEHIVFLRCNAYQDDKVIATCTANFMRLGKKIPFDKNVSENTSKDIEFRDSSLFVESNATNLLDLNSPPQIIDAIPYAKFIGMTMKSSSSYKDIYFVLNRKESNLGNPVFKAIHGGVIGGFMQLSAGLHLLLSNSSKQLPKVIDFSIDYLRAAMDQNTFVKCTISRKGTRVANVDIIAWQTSEKKPIATARSHFLLV